MDQWPCARVRLLHTGPAYTWKEVRRIGNEASRVWVLAPYRVECIILHTLVDWNLSAHLQVRKDAIQRMHIALIGSAATIIGKGLSKFRFLVLWISLKKLGWFQRQCGGNQEKSSKFQHSREERHLVSAIISHQTMK